MSKSTSEKAQQPSSKSSSKPRQSESSRTKRSKQPKDKSEKRAKNSGRNEEDTVAPRSAKSVLALEEKSFPRGGASVLTPIERKQIQIEADRDALFEESGKKRPLPKDISEGEDDGDTEGHPQVKKKRKTKVVGQTSREEVREKVERIESLSYKKLVPGSLVLGQVVHVTSKEVVMALPNNLTGYVPLTAVSRALSRRIEKLLEEGGKSEDQGDESEDFEDVDIRKLFRPGQFLRASVTSNDDMRGGKQRRHLELSLEPELANKGLNEDALVEQVTVQASVSSIEDGGLVMDLGIEGVKGKGFITATELGSGRSLTDVEEGGVLLCMITGHSASGRVIKMTADPEKIGDVNGHFLTNAPTINAFLPGTAANILVAEANSSGVRGTIMGMLNVTADAVHAGGVRGKQELEKKYKAGAKVRGRVLFALPSNEGQKIGLTMLEHVLALSSKSLTNKNGVEPLEQLPLSSTVDSATVIHVEPRLGIYLDVGVSKVPAFVHISRLNDKKVDDVSADIGPFKLRSTHKARILGYNSLDGLFLASLQETVLSQPFLRVEDVKPGSMVDATVEELQVKSEGLSGLLVRLAENVRGFVPAHHLADVQLKHPERKFRAGQRIRARVLAVHPERQAVYLTLKKSLVGSEAEPWTSFDAIKIGDQAPGTISKLTKTGALIKFYGEVRGYLPIGEMSEAYIKDPSEHFREGQVVNVHVISLDRAAKRMLLSCKDQSVHSKEREEAFNKLQVGDSVNGTVIELANDMATLELEHGVQGLLRALHLTDRSAKTGEAALSKLRAGRKLEQLIVLQKMEGSRTVRLTAKPSLVKAAESGKLLASLDGVRKGRKAHGFISNITATGVFVEFANRLTGLIPPSGMPDSMRLRQSNNFDLKIGQSITGTIWNIYPGESRFTLTLLEQDDFDDIDEKEARKPKQKLATRAAPELINPVDDKLSSIHDIEVGSKTLARVNAIKGQQLNISLADNLHGRIHITEVFSDFDVIVDSKKPLESIKHNSVIPITVLGIHNAKTYKYLPLSHRRAVHPVYECSHRQAKAAVAVNLIISKLEVGEERLAFIRKYAGGSVIADLSPEVSGSIDLSELASIDIDYEAAFPIGCALRVKVTKIDNDKGRLYLSPIGARAWIDQNTEQGDVVMARVARAHADGLEVQLPNNARGLVPLVELDDDYERARPDSWSKLDAIRVKMLQKGDGKGLSILSARASVTSSSKTLEVRDRRIATPADVSLGQTVRGFVKKISEQGMLVRIGYETTAQVPVHEISDKFIKNFKSLYSPRQLVEGKIIKADAESGHHKMSLRHSVVNNNKWKPELTFQDLQAGQIVDGKVVKVESYGVFILIDNSRNVRGLCHVKELASARVEDPTTLYSDGDKVKAKVIKVDKEKRQINFSLKAEHFQDLPEDETGLVLHGEVPNMERTNGEDLDQEQDREAGTDAGSDADSDTDMEDAPGTGARAQLSANKGLSTNGFDWTGAAGGEPEASELSEHEPEQTKKKRRRAEIQVDRTGEMDVDGPQRSSDFERQLLGLPNSSALWVQYMAFHLGANDVDKAREIGERALKTIHMREEEAKSNVWVAMLNLENTFGTEDTLDAVFERACQYMEKRIAHERLATIYIESGKYKEAESLFERMRKVKELSTSPDYWLNFASFYMTTLNQPDSARSLLQRATQTLPTHQHAHLISRFGALEFQSLNGDVERGRTIFEGLIDTYSKSWDLWDQYLAQETSARGDKKKARALFERMAKSKMKTKRAKGLFKRWLEWEKGSEGNDKWVARVKFLAEEWVAAHAKSETDADAGELVLGEDGLGSKSQQKPVNRGMKGGTKDTKSKAGH